MIKQEHNETCKRIADELHRIACGDVWKCECCDNEFDNEKAAENCCEGYAAQMTAYDYIADALDIDYLINSRFELKGVKLLVGFGGPNIYVSTIPGNCGVYLYWWGDEGHAELSDEAMAELDMYAQELYDMR